MSHQFFSSSSTALDTSVETVEQYLARGGCIIQCPPKSAQGAVTYAPMISIDGHELPLGTGGDEYIPNYVRDTATYDTAQSEPLTVEDDASAAIVRHDVARVTNHLVSAYTIAMRRASNEGADIMEV